MITQNTKRMLSAVLTLLLAAVSPPRLNGVQDPAGDAGNPTEAAPMSLSQLQALVAPIALYPDALVAFRGLVLEGGQRPRLGKHALWWVRRRPIWRWWRGIRWRTIWRRRVPGAAIISNTIRWRRN